MLETLILGEKNVTTISLHFHRNPWGRHFTREIWEKKL